MYNSTRACLLSKAIERLHVNKMLTTTCLQLLETSANAFKQHVDKRVTHTMLIANNKLLSLHSLYERTHNVILLCSAYHRRRPTCVHCFAMFTSLCFSQYVLYHFSKNASSLEAVDQLMLILLSNVLFGDEDANSPDIRLLTSRYASELM